MTPRAGRPMERTSVSLKRMESPWRVAEKDFLIATRHPDTNQFIALIQGQGNNARSGAGCYRP